MPHTKIKIEIKNRWTGSVLFSYEKEDNTIRETVKEAISVGADLGSADLEGADLGSADLRSANLVGANLRSANLVGANLRSADLRSADLRSADLEGADLRSADLEGADLEGADLRSADLSAIKDDLFAVLLRAIPEIPALKQAILDGKIDGTTYSGDCCCLNGTLCKSAPTAQLRDLAMTARNSSRPIERFFLSIRPGDTPENNQAAKIAMGWIEEFESYIKTNAITTSEVGGGVNRNVDLENHTSVS